MIRALVRWKRLDAILPEKDMESSAVPLRTYWQRFRAAYPTHEIFDRLTEDMYSTTLPIKIHGDEGKSDSIEFTSSLFGHYIVFPMFAVLEVYLIHFFTWIEMC